MLELSSCKNVFSTVPDGPNTRDLETLPEVGAAGFFLPLITFSCGLEQLQTVRVIGCGLFAAALAMNLVNSGLR